MRGKVVFILILGSALLPWVAVLLYRKPINTFYSQTEGVFASLALLLSIYIGIAEYYYLKSERFYLWVQRQVLRWRRVHTYWRFTVRYSQVDSLLAEGRSTVPAVQGQILAAFRASFPGKPLVETSLKNALSVVVDDVDRFDFTFDIDADEIGLQTSKMRVPSDIYWSFLDTLVNLLGNVEKAIRPKETAYRLELVFEKNPYFGFFVRHVPEKLLNHFRCSFQSSISTDCRVEATKDAIYLDCPSNTTLDKVARGYLSLSSRLVTQGKAG